MTDADVQIELRAAAQELCIRRRAETRVVSIGDAILVSEGERRNLPPDTEAGHPYREVLVTSRYRTSVA